MANVFWRLHTSCPMGSLSVGYQTVKELAVAVLRAMNHGKKGSIGRTYKMRLVELEWNAERTAGTRKVQEIVVQTNNLRNGL